MQALKKALFFLMVSLFVSFSPAGATDIFLIQGYDPSVLTDKSMPKYGEATFDSYWGAKSTSYWQAWTQKLTTGHNVRVLKWSSKDRMPQILKGLVTQIQTEMKNGFCKTSCIVVSHSTGGPVTTRLLEASRKSSGTADDYSAIWDRVAFAVHMAPAWNGAILAELAVNIAKGSCSNFILEAAASVFLKGIQCNTGTESLGVSNDLVRSNMVNNNGVDASATPNFPVSGEGSDYFSTTSVIIPGNDDGVLSADSTCGARWNSNGNNSYDSCSANQAYNGEQTSKSAPTALYNDVYPLIMTGESHGQMMSLANAGTSEVLIKHTTYGYRSAKEETSTSGIWLWKKNYINLVSDNTKPSGQYIKEIFF